MNTKIHAFKTTTLSALVVTSTLLVATLSTNLQAAPWKTIPGSACQASLPGNLKPGQVEIWSEYIKHKDVAGGPSSTTVYCPIKMDDNSPQTIGVWVDYTKADTLSCRLYTNHWKGLPKTSVAFNTPNGSVTSYKTITTGTWWSIQVLCRLGNGDKITAINYNAL